MSSTSNKLLTISEAASALGVSTKTLRRWEKAGKITSVRTRGGHRRYNATSLKAPVKKPATLSAPAARQAPTYIPHVPQPAPKAAAVVDGQKPQLPVAEVRQSQSRAVVFSRPQHRRAVARTNRVRPPHSAFQLPALVNPKRIARIGLFVASLLLLLSGAVFGSRVVYPRMTTGTLLPTKASLVAWYFGDTVDVPEEAKPTLPSDNILGATVENTLFGINIQSIFRRDARFNDAVSIGNDLTVEEDINLQGQLAFSSSVSPNIPGFRLNPDTDEIEYRDEDTEDWIPLDSLDDAALIPAQLFTDNGTFLSPADSESIRAQDTTGANFIDLSTLGTLGILQGGAGNSIAIQPNADTDDYIYFTTTSDQPGLFFAGAGGTTDAGLRVNSSTGQIEFRNRDGSFSTLSSLADGSLAGDVGLLDGGGYVHPIDNDSFRVYDSTGTDYIDIAHDGTNVLVTTSGTSTISYDTNLSTTGTISLPNSNTITGQSGYIDLSAGLTVAGTLTLSSLDCTGNANGGTLTADASGVISCADDDSGGAGVWTTDSNVVNLNTDSDDVTIGSATQLAKLGVDGDSDEIQLLVQGNGTQTSNLFVAETSTGTDVFTIDNSGNISVGGTLTLNSETISDFTGNGLTLSSNALTIQPLTSADALSSTTGNGSGLEVLPSGIGLLQGCANGEILKWNETNDQWECASDAGGSFAIVNVENNDVAVGASVDTIDFSTDFSVVASPANEANVSIADDILNFTELADALSLDAATTITNGLAGDFDIDLTSTGDFTVSDAGTPFVTFTDGGAITVADNANFGIGTGNDLTLVHNGTNTVLTSATGDLVIDNTLVTGSTIVQLGTDTSATDFQVQNDTGTSLLTIDGSGQVTISGLSTDGVVQVASGVLSSTDPSSQTSVNNAGTTVIQDVSLDNYGRVTGLASVDLSTSFDNYGSWTFAVDGTSYDTITSGDILDFVSGSGITVTRSLDDQITITAADTSATNELQNLWATITAQSGSTTADSNTDNLTINGAGIASTAIVGDTLTITATEAQQVFTTIVTSSGTNPVADTVADTLTFTAGSNVTITGDETTDTITVAVTGLDNYSSWTISDGSNTEGIGSGDSAIFAGGTGITTSYNSTNNTLTINGDDAVADGSTKGVATFTAADFDSSSGLISLDYANGQEASGAQDGFLSSTDWTTFNNKQDALGYTAANNALSNLASVAINTSLISDTNNTDDLGSSAIQWANLYSVNATISGALSLGPTNQVEHGTCDASSEGTVYYDGNTQTIYFCNGTSWTALSSGSSLWSDNVTYIAPDNVTDAAGSTFRVYDSGGVSIGVDADPTAGTLTVGNTDFLTIANTGDLTFTDADGAASITGPAGGTLDIFAVGGDLQFGADNDATNLLTLSSDANDLTLGTTDAANLTIDTAGSLTIADAATFSSTAGFNGVATFNTDADFALAAGENVTLTNTSASVDQLSLAVSGVVDTGVDGLSIAFTQADDADATDTNAALNLSLTSSSGDADTLYGLNIANLTAGAASETAINIGTGWDTGISVNSGGVELADSTPSTTTSKLYNSSGSLYWNGTIVATGTLDNYANWVARADSGTDENVTTGYILDFTGGSGITTTIAANTLTIDGDDAAADGSTKGVATFTAADFDSSSGLISIDYANGQEASGAQDGFLSSTDWTTFNNKQDALGYTAANNALSNLASVAINTSLISDTNNTDDLGSSAIQWANLYAVDATLSGSLAIGPSNQVEHGTCDASSEGTMYYDGSNNKLYFCNGTSWGSVAEGGTTEWTLGGGIVYPNSATTDMAVGGTTAAAPLFFDESATTLKIGDSDTVAATEPTISFYTSEATSDVGTLTYSDTQLFSLTDSLSVANDITADSLYIRDTTQDNTIRILTNEDVTGDRTFTLDLDNANRILRMGADATFLGATTVNQAFTVGGSFGTIVNSEGQINTLTLNESFTIGDGGAGTLTFTGTDTLTVEGASAINQDVTSDSTAVAFGDLALNAAGGLTLQNGETITNAVNGSIVFTDTGTQTLTFDLDATTITLDASTAIFAVNENFAVYGTQIGLDTDTNVNNLLATSSTGTQADTSLYWGDDLLCNPALANCGWATAAGASSNYWQLNSNVIAPGNDGAVTDRVVIGGQTSTNFYLGVDGARPGFALVGLNETGDQNILTASASGVPVANLTRTGELELLTNGGLVLYDADNSHSTTIRANATTTTSETYYLPATDGSNNQVLATDSNGNLSWIDVSAGTGAYAGWSIADDDDDSYSIASSDLLKLYSSAGTITTDLINGDDATDELNLDVADDSLNFTELAASLSVDENTTIALGTSTFDINLDSTGDFAIQDGGTDVLFVAAATGTITISDDLDLSLAATENVTLTNTTLTDTGDVLDINFTLGDDADVDTLSALNIDVTSAATGDADVLYGINVGNLTSADATVLERAIRIGSGWDEVFDINGTLLSAAEVTVLDGGITLGTETDGNYVASVTNGNGITGGDGGSETAALTLAVDETYAFSWSGTHDYSAADINFTNATSSTLDVTGDLILDADGADVVLADGGVTFATFTNSTTDLTIDVAGGQVIFADGDTFSIGGATGDRAYNSISAATAAGVASGDNDLYIENVLEVDGSLYVGSTGIQITDILDEDDLNSDDPNALATQQSIKAYVDNQVGTTNYWEKDPLVGVINLNLTNGASVLAATSSATTVATFTSDGVGNNALQAGGTSDYITIDENGNMDLVRSTGWTSGIAFNLDFGGATTQTGDITGLNLDFNTNFTGQDDFDFSGVNIQTPGFTADAASTVTTSLYGFNVSGAGALDTTADSNTSNINWYGAYIKKPNIDTGHANDAVYSTGLYIADGTTTNGAGTETNYGIIVEDGAGQILVGATGLKPTNLTANGTSAKIYAINTAAAQQVTAIDALGIHSNVDMTSTTSFNANLSTLSYIDPTGSSAMYYLGAYNVAHRYGTDNITGRIYGSAGVVEEFGTSGTISSVRGVSGTTGINSAAGNVTWTNAIGGYFNTANSDATSSTITNAYGVYVGDGGHSGAATNQAGLAIETQIGGTNRVGLLFSAGGSGSNPLTFPTISQLYSIYDESALDSYFSGDLGIGDTTPDAKLNIQATTEQLRLDYDDSNYYSFTVASDGGMTLAGTGTDADLTITAADDIFFDDAQIGGTIQLSDADGSFNSGDTGIIDAINAAWDAATGGTSALWTRSAQNVLSPTQFNDVVAATSSATTVATFTSSGSNTALRAGGASAYVTVDQNGDITFVDAAGGANITGPAGGSLAISSTTTQALTLDSGTTGAVNLGTGNNAKTINIGTGNAGNTFNIGTDNSVADDINIGSALDNVSITGDEWSVTDAGAATFASVVVDNTTFNANALTVADGNTLTLNVGGGDAAGEDLVFTANNVQLTATGALTLSPDVAVTTAIDLTDTDFTNALSIGDNNIIGTTAAIDFSNFDVATTGNITVAAGQGLDTNAAGILSLGDTTATTVSLGSTAATTINLGAGGALARAINIGTGTGADTINIGTGGTTADDINIGGLATSTIDVLGVSTFGDGGSTNYASFNATGDLTFNGSADTITGPGAAGLAVTNTSGDLTFTTVTSGEIDLTSAGLIDINAGANFDVDVTGTIDLQASGAFSIDGTGASNVTATSGDLVLSTITSGELDLTSAGLLDINAAANLDIDVTGTYDMLATGAFSIDGTGASNLTATSGDLTISTATSGDLLLTSADDIIFDDAQIGGTIQLSDVDGSFTSGDTGIIDAINAAWDAATGGTSALWTRSAQNVLSPTQFNDVVAATSSATTVATFTSTSSTDTGLAFLVEDEVNDTTPFVIDNAGQVGIGTNAPTALLEISQAGTLDAFATYKSGQKLTYIDDEGSLFINADTGGGPNLTVKRDTGSTYFTVDSTGINLQSSDTTSSDGALVQLPATSTLGRESSGDISAINILSTFNPTASTAHGYGLKIEPTINQSGTATGDFTAFMINPTNTSFLGTTLRLVDIGLGGSSYFTMSDLGDTDLILPAGSNFTIDAASTPTTVDALSLSASTVTTGVDGLSIAFTQADDADATDTNALLNLVATSSSGDADTLYGLNIANLTAGAANETAINIGTGWDTDLAFADTSPLVTIGDTGTLTITDGSNTLLTLNDNANAGDLGITGDLTVSGGDIIGAATTNIANAATTLNLGSTAVARTINLGTGTSTDAINIGTDATGADTIAIGNSNASSTLALTGGDDWSITSAGVLSLSTGTTNPINLTRTASGQWLGMTDGTDTFGVYNYAGTPEANVTANIGSLAVDTTNGALYVKTTSDGDASNWTQLVSNASSPFTVSGGIIDKNTAADRLRLQYGEAGDTQLEIDSTTNTVVPSADAVVIDWTSGATNTGVVTDGADALAINAEFGNGTTNTNAGIHLDIDPVNTPSGDENFYAVLIDAITGTSANEVAISVGTGWDVGLDLSGTQLDLDADNDTSITASTDDQIDFEIAGADEYIFTAGVFDIGNGTQARIDFDDDNDTSIRASADDTLAIELAGADDFTFTANTFTALTGSDIVLEGAVDVILGNNATTLDIGADAKSSGSFIDVTYDTVEVQTGNLTGMLLDLNTNLTGLADADVRGYQLQLPALTSSTTATTNYDGFYLSATGALVQDTLAGTINWDGADIRMPAITQTTGTITVDGFSASNSTITTGGTASLFHGVATGVGAGTLYGLNLDNITGSSGTETAVNIGSGWDVDLAFVDTTPTITVGDGGTLSFTDGTNTLLSLVDAGTTSILNGYGAFSFGDTTPDGNAYNTIGTGDAGHTAGGEIEDGSDLYITDDLEVDGTIFADGGITTSSLNGTIIVDGTTYAQSCTGINAAIAALPAEGGEIYLPEATYSCTEQILIDKSNVTIRGAGWSTIIQPAIWASWGVVDDVIYASSKAKITLQDFQLDGTNLIAGGQSAHMIYLNQTSDSTIDHILVDGGDNNGIFLANTAALRNTINNNTVRNVDGNGIYAQADETQVTGNTVYSNGGIGIYLQGDQIMTSNNIVRDNTGAGISITNASPTIDVIVIGNTIENNSNGISFSADTQNSIIANNTIRTATTYGIYGQCGTECDGMKITGNTIINPGNSGIYLDRNFNHLIVSNNTIIDDGTATYGIRTNNTPYRVRNSQFVNNTISGFSGGSAIGIRLTSPSDLNNVIAYNTFQNNTTNITDNGVGTQITQPEFGNVAFGDQTTTPLNILSAEGTSWYDNALFRLNETGGNDIFTASASGTTVATLGNSGDLTLSGDITVSGGDIIGAATTNIANASTTLNLGDTDMTRTINVGTGENADTINIGTGGTTADDINIGGLATSTIGILGVTSIGDGGSTNYAQFNATGDLTFVGTANTITGPGANGLALTNTSGDLTFTTVTGGEIDLTSAGLIDINAGANLDIDVTGTIDLLASGAFSIDGTGASNLTATSGDLTLSTATSGSLVLTSADDITNTIANAGTSLFTITNGSNSWFTLVGDTGYLGLGTDNTNPAMELDVAGSATVSGTLSLGPTNQVEHGTCDASSEGTMYYDGTANAYYYCNGSSWGAIAGAGGSPWTDGSGITYLTDTAEDLAVGASTLVAPFSVDIDTQTTRLGTGATANAVLDMYASNAATGKITYTTADEWNFTGGNINLDGALDLDVDSATAFTVGDGTENFLTLDATTDTGDTLLTLNDTSNITTGTIFSLVGDAISSGVGFDISVDGLTTGTGFNLASTSTVFSTGNLMSLDWSPTGSTEIYATDDLFKINVGQYGNVGNLFALYDNGTELFSVSQTGITSALPHSFTAAGDVSMAYDLVMTNQTSSKLTSYGPLTVESGESFENNNLTLKTYGTGSTIVDGKFSIGTQATLSVNDTSPTVAGGNYFVTANTTSTSLLTTFDDGTNGQIVVIEINDAFTDFDCTGASFNCGTADLTAPAAGDILTWIYDGTNWNLIGFVINGGSNNAGADLAEYYPSNDSLVAGEVVAVDAGAPIHVTRNDIAYDADVLGIVSTQPGIILGEGGENQYPIALSGRVPVKVTAENGTIQPGDEITTSSTPGKAMKATQSGPIIGIALEAWDGGNGDDDVMVFVNRSWYDPEMYLTDAGDLTLPGSATIDGDLVVDGTNVMDALAQAQADILALQTSTATTSGELATGRLGVGVTAPATDSGKLIDTAAGAYLSTAGVWTNVSDVNSKENFTALDEDAVLDAIVDLPITRWNYKVDGADITHIGPTAQDFHAAFGTGNDNRTISTLDPASIALVGVKALNGRLDDVANQLALAEDGTIDMTERLNELVEQAEDFNDRLAELESQKPVVQEVVDVRPIEDRLSDVEAMISELSNIVNGKLDRVDTASQAAILDELAALDAQSLETLSDAGIIDELAAASTSGELADSIADVSYDSLVDDLALFDSTMNLASVSAALTAQTLELTGDNSDATLSNLLVTGDATLNNVGIAGNLTAGFITVDGIAGSISTTIQPLQLQTNPLAGNIEAFNRKIVMTPSGDIEITGTLTAERVVSQEVIAEKTTTAELTLNKLQVATSAAQVAEIATASARIAHETDDVDSLLLSLLGDDALTSDVLGATTETATSAAELADPTIGSATLSADKLNVVIFNNSVTENSTIFVTPTTVTDKILSVSAKVAGEGFIVSVKDESDEPVSFNWWIIN